MTTRRALCQDVLPTLSHQVRGGWWEGEGASKEGWLLARGHRGQGPVAGGAQREGSVGQVSGPGRLCCFHAFLISAPQWAAAAWEAERLPDARSHLSNRLERGPGDSAYPSRSVTEG